MGKIVRLTESDLVKLIKRVINESSESASGGPCNWGSIPAGLRNKKITLKYKNGKTVTFDNIQGIEGDDKQGINIYLDKSKLRQIQMTDKTATLFERKNTKETFRGNPGGKWTCSSENGKTVIKLNFNI
jgi:hypothetical protein